MTSLSNPDVQIFNVVAADTSAGERGPCTYDATTGQFVCPSQTHDGITFTARFTLYDANGNVQSKFDPNTTASIKTETTASGTTTRNGATMTVNRIGVMITSGLGPSATTHTLNGSEQGMVSMTNTVDGMAMTMNTSISGTTIDLVVPIRRPDSGPAYPLSGVRIHETTGTTTHGGVTRTTTMSRKETFTGTSVVQVEMTVNGVTQTCSYDLAARTTTCHR